MLVQRRHSRLLILDEGGKLIVALHEEPRLRTQAHRVVCVEQTEKGILEVERMQASGIHLACPVWNVARCDLKKSWEGPIIGVDVVLSTWRMLDDIGFERGALLPKEAVVLGYGAVGKGVAQALLRENWQVFVYDPNEARSEEARQGGCIISDRAGLLRNILPHAYLLFGCAGCLPGHAALSGDVWEHLPEGALVVNGASGDYQFSWKTNAEDTHLTCDDGKYKSRWREQNIILGRTDEPFPHRILVVADKRLLVAFGGCPVNRVVDIPAPYIDLTQALMLETSILAILSPDVAPGLHDIPNELQKRIRQGVERHLQQRGRSLVVPDLNSFDIISQRRPAGLPDAVVSGMRAAVQAEQSWGRRGCDVELDCDIE